MNTFGWMLVAAMGGRVPDVGEALITAKTISSSVIVPDQGLAQIAFRTVANGNLETRILNQAWMSVAGEWFVSGVESDMELLVTNVSGTPSGSPGGWVSGVAISLGTVDRVWARIQTVDDVGFETWTASYEIFHTPTGRSLSGPVNITLRAQNIT